MKGSLRSFGAHNRMIFNVDIVHVERIVADKNI